MELSAREREVLILASKGCTDKSISGKLGISIRTIGTYWERMRIKTKGNSRANIIMLTLGKELEAQVEDCNAKIDLLVDEMALMEAKSS